jgi:hypothetical protein
MEEWKIGRMEEWVCALTSPPFQSSILPFFHSSAWLDLIQNRLNSFFEFGDVRTAPVRLPTLRATLKVVVVQTRERLEQIDNYLFWHGGQQAIAAQTPDKRRKRSRESEASNYFHSLFHRMLGAREVTGFNGPVHQQRAIARKECAIFSCHCV